MDKTSELYQGHAKKYIGREHLMLEQIPVLNCKWNDVVQFSALDPQIIAKELIKHQPDLKLLRPEYYKVHVDQIINNFPAVVFNRKVPRKEKDFTIDPPEVELLSSSYCELEDVPTATLNCWEKAKRENGKLLWFPFIPHILVKGQIPVDGFQVCKLTL